ncbi:MAG: hypothetical protein GX557_03710, partial [Chloroflexi bacterium]|nr:hypothetical protein [Chloroflexota bacterium]
RRRWTELLAAAGVMIAGTALAMLFDVTVVRQYARSMVADGPIWWYTPTLGGALRAWLGPEHIWLQFAPMLLGSGWLALRLQQVRAWRWATEAPLLVLISVITAAYGWTFDQAVILVAIFEAAERLAGMLRQRSAIVLMITAVGLNGAVLWLHGLMVEGWFWWLAPAWLGWYLLSRHWAPGCTSDGAGQDNVETGRA